MKKNKSLEERFWEKIKKSDRCWEWTAAKTADGYGRIGDGNGKNLKSNRASWLLSFGPIPDGMCVCHKCDNRLCVRPDHLFLGTQQDNVADMIKKNRLARGESRGMSWLKEPQIREIRRIYAEGKLTQTEIAALVGTTSDNISRIVNGRRWSHVS